jgi:heme A synthase
MNRGQLHSLSEFFLKLFIGFSILFGFFGFLTDLGRIFMADRITIISLVLFILSAVVYLWTKPDSVAVDSSESISDQSPKKVSSIATVMYMLIAVLGGMFTLLALAFNDSGSQTAAAIICILYLVFLFALYIGWRSRLK